MADPVALQVAPFIGIRATPVQDPRVVDYENVIALQLELGQLALMDCLAKVLKGSILICRKIVVGQLGGVVELPVAVMIKRHQRTAFFVARKHPVFKQAYVAQTLLFRGRKPRKSLLSIRKDAFAA